MNWYAGLKLDVEAVFDREIRDKLTQLLAYQRDAPVRLRIVTPCIGNAKLADGLLILDKLRRLINFKYARVTLIVDEKGMEEEPDQEFLEALGESGLGFITRRNFMQR